MTRHHVTRRDFLRSSGALLASSGALGLAGGKYPKKKPSPTPTTLAGTGNATELTPHPTAAELQGGPQWKAPDLEGKTLQLWGLLYQPHVQRYQYLAKAFTAKTGAKVNIQALNDPHQSMLTGMASGNVPDVVCVIGKSCDTIVRNHGFLPVDNILFKPLKIDMKKWWTGDGLESFYWTEFGHHYAVPVESNGHNSVAVRTDLVAQHGSEAAALYPGSISRSSWPNSGVWFESMDEMYNLAKMLQTRGSNGQVKIWGLNSQDWEEVAIATLMHMQGVKWWDESSRKWNLNNDACAEAWNLLITKPFQLGIETTLGVGNLENAFVAGEVAVANGVDNSAGNAAPLGIPGEQIVHPPLEKGKVPVFMGEGGWGFALPAQAKNKSLGLEFAKFMTTYEAQFTWSQIYGGMDPACKAITNSAIYNGTDPLRLGFQRQLVSLEHTTYYGHFNPADITTIENTAADIRSGKLTPKQAASQLQSQLTAADQRYYAQFGS